MENRPKVLLGMSGGVDSSVAAILLQEQGYDVIGITMKLWEDERFAECEGGCCNLSSTIDAKRVCDKLNIPHYTLNFKEEFKDKVINDFIEKYLDAKTPNPCIECNRYLKFGSMYKRAQELGAEYISTGHYAKIEFDKKYDKFVMKKSDSINKDQTYALYNIPKEIVSKVLFPLGNFKTKDEIRAIAEKHNLNVAKKPDSQEICFIPDNNYIRFISENVEEKFSPGNIVGLDGKIYGKHEGIIKYTVGQRKGLGISNPTPLFVIKLSKETNEVIIGEEKDLYVNELVANDLNIILFDEIVEPIKVTAKIRYSSVGVSATLFPSINGEARLIFDEPQKAITPGQAVVFYLDDVVLGGGKIK